MPKLAHVTVTLGGRIKTSEQLIRLFSKKCKKEKIVQEFKKKQYHESKGTKRRRQKAAGKARHKSQQKK
jgi:ribosomal protein S21